MSSPSLSMAIASYGCTRAIKNGDVPLRGVDVRPVEVSPIIAAFRRMVRDLEFDICELAPTTYVIARAAGVPITALPIFLSRRFHHSGLQVRTDAGIDAPKDLEGKKVGVRAYSVTTGVWTRGILANEYGVDNDRIEWIVDDEEHVTSLKLPPNVSHAPEGKSLSAMMASGEIQAGFTSRAGIGRSGAPTAGWEAAGKDDTPGYRELFDNAPELEAAWYRKTGVYPVHGCVVVRNDVLRAFPFLPDVLFEAFEEAKQRWLADLRSGAPDVPDRDKYAGVIPFVGEDPLPNGLEANRATLETLVTYAWQQKLIPRRIPVEELFLDTRKANAA
ncbi:phosphate/phosphite/phosphonate ABC transporter substrate-binding protein [Rhizobiaceae bacterium BDR2-2]|uniref:Phosphate/phosphite/phosphonate ABC transporter substrate-binding protein n=1 Tax=Ectorhizobium quercum TaxID=2965071 RepID=A0AAE3MZ09_9HYPH|nr:PhnD/SsuA/transferrin family substrate-binding protein [Ectorhizobium quercum]MCX8997086.1 phosphate/phosphite/phosphonate ABC transporter substrate-binding protein [Ectorhizobium quercum]